MGTGGSFPRVKRSRGVMLTTHPHLVPRLSMSRSYTSSPPRRIHGVSWTALLFLHINNISQTASNSSYWLTPAENTQVPRGGWNAANCCHVHESNSPISASIIIPSLEFSIRNSRMKLRQLWVSSTSTCKAILCLGTASWRPMLWGHRTYAYNLGIRWMRVVSFEKQALVPLEFEVVQVQGPKWTNKRGQSRRGDLQPGVTLNRLC
jgi:hypothetical protein